MLLLVCAACGASSSTPAPAENATSSSIATGTPSAAPVMTGTPGQNASPTESASSSYLTLDGQPATSVEVPNPSQPAQYATVPPSSIPSESDILPRESLIGLGIQRSSISPYASPEGSPNTSPRTLYPPTLYDSIDLSDPAVLERNNTGKVVAGTAEGLVAYITSPDCLDYDVLSDFFMMYRKFMSPTKLLGLLCARFEWGLIRGAVVKPPDNEGSPESVTATNSRHGSSEDLCGIETLVVELFCRRFCTIR